MLRNTGGWLLSHQVRHHEDGQRRREIFVFSVEQTAASGRQTPGNMVSLRPMRARQCAAWWWQVNLETFSILPQIFSPSSLSGSGKIYHQALVDQNTCNDPNYIARIAFNVAKNFRDPGSKITVRWWWRWWRWW